MELWIRSQDKEVLTRVVDIWKVADKNEIWSQSSFAIKNCLGTYKTKERALEVLDEIQKVIEPRGIIKQDRHGIEVNMISVPKVYEMPKE